MSKLYSNEIVFAGHPDKVCDQISATILQWCIRKDPHARCGIEVAGGKGKIFITGEITINNNIYNNKNYFNNKIKEIVINILKEVGYPTGYEIINNIGTQSPDIALGTNDEVGGAGDNGMMFGYACNDNPELLPTAQVILQKFAQEYDKLRQLYPDTFYPDGKAQITGVYDEDFKLQKIKTFTICYQNCEAQRVKTDKMLKDLALFICGTYGINEIDEFLINPTGKFLIGGFTGDAGLTGRKIVVDSYQSFANVGGGCLNGKDPTKVDFSGAHKARQIAIDYLKQYDLKWCEVQLSYAIGKAEPLAIYINSDKGEFEAPNILYIQCKPSNIIKDLKLLDINYIELAKFGHFTKGA